MQLMQRKPLQQFTTIGNPFPGNYKLPDFPPQGLHFLVMVLPSETTPLQKKKKNLAKVRFLLMFVFYFNRYTVKREKGSIGMSVIMDPMANK